MSDAVKVTSASLKILEPLVKEFLEYDREKNSPKGFLSLFKKRKSRNFYKDIWVPFVNGRADDHYYIVALERWHKHQNMTFIPNYVQLQWAKDAVRRQWRTKLEEYLIKCGVYMNPDEYAVSPTNYLIMQAVIEGYYDPNRKYKDTIG